jgi:hypothetical protein
MYGKEVARRQRTAVLCTILCRSKLRAINEWRYLETFATKINSDESSARGRNVIASQFFSTLKFFP